MHQIIVLMLEWVNLDNYLLQFLYWKTVLNFLEVWFIYYCKDIHAGFIVQAVKSVNFD